MIAASVVGLFQGEIGRFALLAVLMPIVSGMGGNAGTQTLAVVVRALATNQLTDSNTVRMVLREFRIATANGLALGALIGLGTLLIFHRPDLSIVIAAALPAASQELKIGLKTEPSSLDPQYHNLGPNNQIASHLFDPLVAKDDKQLPIPGLALSWTTISDTAWEFKLRPDVKFHDGSAFTAQDVVFTFERAAEATSQSRGYANAGGERKKIDNLAVEISRAQVNAICLQHLNALCIMSKA